jgi:chromosome segregation ATPase
MSPFLSAALVFLAVASNRLAGATSAVSSISQVQSTLQNLLRSIEDNGQTAEALLNTKEAWCQKTIHQFEVADKAAKASISDLQSQLKETDSEVFETQSSIQQMKADLTMAQRTMQQTQDSVEPVGALTDNKHLSIASLEAQITKTTPLLAQLQASVAETRQRISFRTDTAAATRDFTSALKTECQTAVKRANARNLASANQSAAVASAVSALHDVSGTDEAEDQDAQASGPSFVQVAKEAQEAALEDFGSFFAQHRVRAPLLRPSIRALLNQLKQGVTANVSDQTAWCNQQRERSDQAVKFAQYSVEQVKSQMDAHTSAEKECADDLSRLGKLSAAIAKTSKAAADQAHKENAFVQRDSKDQTLAAKILGQAMVILNELGMSESGALTSLASAKSLFAAEVKSLSETQQEPSSEVDAVHEKAQALNTAIKSEQSTLELAQEDHASQRLEDGATKSRYEKDVTDATAFEQKIAETCKVDTAVQNAEQQRAVQVHALEDADKALDGKLLEPKPAASLRGSETGSSQAPKNLTPMQRAALEMGIAIDQ